MRNNINKQDNSFDFSDLQAEPIAQSENVLDFSDLQATSNSKLQATSNSKNEYSGQNPTAAFAKNAAAGFIGGIPDIGIGIYNTIANKENQSPYITDTISNAIDKFTKGYTKDTGPVNKHSARFLAGLFGGGALGKGVQTLGATGALGKASSAIEKTGKFIKNHLGVTKPSTSNISAGLAGGAAVGLSEQAELPVYAEIPAIIGSFILGGMFGGGVSNFAKRKISTLKPLYDKVPGLEKFIEKQNYKDLASQINPDAIYDLMKTSLLEKDINYLTEKTISELPQEIQIKLKENPALLTEQEADVVVEKGMNDFVSYIEGIEREYNMPSSLGEFTGSPKVLAKEDALANKPNVETFDKFSKDKRKSAVRNLESTKAKISPKESSAQELGETISKEVDSVYDTAQRTRSQNWKEKFGGVIDEPIISVPNYVNKLKEFKQLNPDNYGSKVSIKAAKERLAAGLEQTKEALTLDENLLLKKIMVEGEAKISPNRLNDILVGLNEDIARFPDKTFSQSQILSLKKALEADLIAATKAEGGLTREQANLVIEARRGWKKDSEVIDLINESDLFNKINKGNISIPERIASKLDNMPKSQLELTIKALKRSPNFRQIMPQIQKYYVTKALNAATKNGPENFNPRMFLENLPAKPEFEVIFGGSNAYKEIKDMSVLLKRMSKYHPTRGNSKTAQRAQADRGDLEEGLETVSNIAHGKWFNIFKDFFNKGGAYDQNVAEIMISPQKRKEIFKYIGKKEDKSPKFATSLQALSSLR